MNSTMPVEHHSMTPKGPEHSENTKVYVPLEALAMPGEDEKMNNPSIGDPVQMMAEGTVESIEGQTACVSVKSVNGKPVTSEAAKTSNTPGENESGDNEFAQLRSDAEQQPDNY